MKVIFVSFVHLNSKISRDYHIDYLLNKNIEIEYWDVVSLFFEKNNISHISNYSFVNMITDYPQLDFLLNKNANLNTIYFFNISNGSKFLKIHRLFSKYKCKIFYISKDALPVSHQRKSIIKKISIHLSNPLNFFKIILDIFTQYFHRKTNIVTSYEVVFKTGISHLSILNHSKKTVFINHPDYEIFKSNLLTEEIKYVSEKYAVFLDVNLAYHIDLSIQGRKKIDIYAYFKSLNSFFEKIEKQYSVKIVIAAHPSVEYKLNEFQDRKIFYSDTANIVKNSEFVISHHSTSVSFAVLNKKPIIFIYTSEMKKLYSDSILLVIEASANYLDSTIINIDNVYNSKDIYIKPLNLDAYNEYKYNFLTSQESENKNSCDIIFETIVSYK